MLDGGRFYSLPERSSIERVDGFALREMLRMDAGPDSNKARTLAQADQAIVASGASEDPLRAIQRSLLDHQPTAQRARQRERRRQQRHDAEAVNE